MIYDSWTMLKRCLTISFRNPESILMAIIIPALMMLLFGGVFGNIVDIGEYNYIDFIVPGIILHSIAQGSIFTAINVNMDMTKGMVDRFRSMSISRASVLVGHAGASVVRTAISTAITIGAAMVIGFRPQGGLVAWLIITGILILYITAIAWIAIFCGVVMKSAESASSIMNIFVILPFVSSGFVPTATMPTALRIFAENQPMTPIVDSLRGFMLGLPADGSLPIALIWCVVIIVAAFIGAVQIYKRKMS